MHSNESFSYKYKIDIVASFLFYIKLSIHESHKCIQVNIQLLSLWNNNSFYPIFIFLIMSSKYNTVTYFLKHIKEKSISRAIPKYLFLWLFALGHYLHLKYMSIMSTNDVTHLNEMHILILIHFLNLIRLMRSLEHVLTNTYFHDCIFDTKVFPQKNLSLYKIFHIQIQAHIIT